MIKAKPCSDCKADIAMGYVHDNRPDDFLCYECLKKYENRLEKDGLYEFIGDWCIEYVEE